MNYTQNRPSSHVDKFVVSETGYIGISSRNDLAGNRPHGKEESKSPHVLFQKFSRAATEQYSSWGPVSWSTK